MEIERVKDTIQAVVSKPMNQLLSHDFNALEVHQALKQMHPTMALGLDGMPPLFYQKFWSLFGNCVTKVVLDFLNHGVALPDFNDTHIVLIPKVKNPSKVTNYRPISLCNVIYKLASKTMANRLKNVLFSIVSENQSAFTKGQFITDNILIAYETMHHISHKRTGKIGEMALKLDMSKAYDRVQWDYLKGIMQKMVSHRRMVEVVMRCVCTVTYSIQINGKPRGHIIPSRALHQGDPFSLYLFLLCAEGLFGLLR